MNVVDTSPNIPEGSHREIQDETHLYIQTYQFGVWNSTIKLPLNDPQMVAHVRNAIERLDNGQLPQPAWPFPTTPEQPAKEPAKDDKQSYIDYVRDTIQGREDEQRFRDYERAKKVVDENR